MSFNRFDICEAYYMFAMLWHDGMGSETYAIFGRLYRLNYKPSPSLSEPSDLGANAREIYKRLVVKKCGMHSTCPQ